MLRVTRVINANVVVEQDNYYGCITETHQCGPCAFNTICSQSIKTMQAEPSPSDWAEITPDTFDSNELNFNN